MILGFVVFYLFFTLLSIIISFKVFGRRVNILSMFWIICSLYALSNPLLYLVKPDNVEVFFGMSIGYLEELLYSILFFAIGGFLGTLFLMAVSGKKTCVPNLKNNIKFERVTLFLFIALILASLSLYGVYNRYFSLSGFYHYFSSSRRDFFEEASGSGLLFFQHYSLFFIALTITCFLRKSLVLPFQRKLFCFLMIAITSYIIINVVVGNRLIFISTLITLFFIYSHKKNTSFKFKHIVSIFILSCIFSTYGNVRHDVKQFIAGDASYEKLSERIEDDFQIFPSEFDTLYEGHRVINQVGVGNIEHNIFITMIPQKILTLLGLNKEGVSRQSAELNPYSSGFAVHVYPFIAEGVFSPFYMISSLLLGLGSVLILSFTYIYVSRRWLLFILFIPVLISNQFYYVRNELSSSFSLFLYSSILSFIVFFILARKKYEFRY